MVGRARSGAAGGIALKPIIARCSSATSSTAATRRPRRCSRASCAPLSTSRSTETCGRRGRRTLASSQSDVLVPAPVDGGGEAIADAAHGIPRSKRLVGDGDRLPRVRDPGQRLGDRGFRGRTGSSRRSCSSRPHRRHRVDRRRELTTRSSGSEASPGGRAGMAELPAGRLCAGDARPQPADVRHHTVGENEAFRKVPWAPYRGTVPSPGIHVRRRLTWGPDLLSTRIGGRRPESRRVRAPMERFTAAVAALDAA